MDDHPDTRAVSLLMTALMGLSKGEKKRMLRAILAHSAGQLAHLEGDGGQNAAATCRRIGDRLVDMSGAVN